MGCKLRIIIEKVDSETNKVITKATIGSFDIHKPESVIELGLRHQEQVNLLKKIQQKVLDEQCTIISEEPQRCPKCKVALKRNGSKQSNFHAVFSDHKIKMQRHTCPFCHESQVPSIKSLFGTSIHPDLYKLQCEMGSSFSFYKSECQLTNLCQEKREINNHQRIKKTVNTVGSALFDISIKNKSSRCFAPSLIIQIDGGHIKDKSTEKRSFEALSAKIYRPESVIKKGHRSVIKDKTCVASAKNDSLKSIKQLIESAAKRQGMTKETKVTIIADGAKNCWQATKILSKDCDQIDYILDWFHIARKFQPLLNMNAISKENKELIEKIKWELWHGKSEKALLNLTAMIDTISDEILVLELKRILIYLSQNKEQLCHYAEREKQGLLFTSHVAESTVEHLINERHKRKQKMQWTRESAHNVLQIRASIASCEWLKNWETAVENTILKAA
jgi:hypothetical protein